MEERLFDETVERVLDEINYEAVLTYKDEVIAKVSATDIVGLEEELYKLSRAEEQLVNEIYDETVSGAYDNADDIIKGMKEEF